MDKIAITTGDPNGIGAEITVKALNYLDIPQDKIVLVSNRKILDYYGKLDKNYEIIEIPYDAELKLDKLQKMRESFRINRSKKFAKSDQKL